MDYFNGISEIIVEDLTYLDNLSQEELNSIAVGPQDKFYGHLEDFNRCLRAHGIEPINVTNKWNWKPGSYDRIKEYINKHLYLDKKSQSVHKLLERTITRNYYLRYPSSKAKALELSRYQLKQTGVNRDVDVDKFKVICSDFVTNITNQCKQVKEITESNVNIIPYVKINENTNVDFYLDITLKNLTMSVFNGQKEIHSSPLGDIHIICLTGLKDVINNTDRNIGWRGIYKSKFMDFPYISANSRESRYGSVCLDKYLDDINKAFKSCDYITMSMYLMSWAQYYNTSYANPYNQPYLLHHGMPENTSKEYYSSFSKQTVQNSCGNRITAESRSNGSKYLYADSDLKQKCIDIKCQFIGACGYNIKANERLDYYSDKQYEIEAYTGLILDYVDGKRTYAKNQLLDSMFGDWVDVSGGEDIYNNNFLNALVYNITNLMTRDGEDTMTYRLEDEGVISIKEVKVAESVKVDLSAINDSEMETLMQTWVESQRS
mgnify:CR=1 FL=1|tara:strand:- start:1149 stop:2618 length:1470 start_codon:yes stop_codon:yes gene_type:complete